MTGVAEKGSRLLLTAIVGMLLALACCLPAPAGAHTIVRVVSPLPSSDYSAQAVCAHTKPGHARCLAIQLLAQSAAARARTHPLGIARSETVRAAGAATEVCLHHKVTENCYGLLPEDLRSAYGLPSTTSAASTQTIALVDAFNDPDAEADLEDYDQALGLSACTSGDGCFRELNQLGESGKPPFPQSLAELAAARKGSASEREEAEEAGGWAGEESLDIEVAHGLCQACRILLVEADSSSTGDMEAAEIQAVRAAATEVSNSWFTGEPEPSVDSPAFNDPGTVVTAAAGDEGFLNWAAAGPAERGLVNYPASSPHVIAVGGTRLELNSPSDTRKSETVWNGKGPGMQGRGASGSGCSEHFDAPSWQLALSDWASVGCAARRAVADVAADGDPYTGVAIYDSTPDRDGQVLQWEDMGGTSLASPIIAAAFALAGGSHGVEYPARTLYESAARAHGSLYDVESGSNGKCLEPISSEGRSGCTPAEEALSCDGQAICLAGSGYDGPSGLGSPEGLAAFEPQGIAPRKTQLVDISSSAPVSATVGGPAYVLLASASSKLAVSLSSATPEVCSLAGSTVSFLASGTCTIDANQEGDSEFDPAPQLQQSFTVGRGAQTIEFTSVPPEPAFIAGAGYPVAASASSGLAVSLSSATPAVCSLTGVAVSFIGAGTCTIDATQAGNVDYYPAPEAHQSFTVIKKAQAIEFSSSPPEPASIGGPAYTVSASASSGGAVSLLSATPSVCPLSGATVSFIAAGTCTIDAEQAGGREYEPAPQAEQSFTVVKKAQLLEFSSSPPASASVLGATYVVSVRSSSGLPVSLFSPMPSVCFLTGSAVSFVGAGTCTLEAMQPGNADYEAAAPIQQTFTVGPEATFAAQLVAPSPSSGVLSLTSSTPPAPDSAFTLLGRPIVNRRTGALTFTVSVANPGTFTWLLTFGRRTVFAKGQKLIAAAGTVSVTLEPSRAAAKALANALAKGAGLSVVATLGFRSSLGGAAASHTQSLSDRPQQLRAAGH